MENKSCVFIDKWLRRVCGHCASLYHPNNSISLRESFRFQTTPTGLGYRHICQDFSPVTAKQTCPFLACCLSHFHPYLSFPIVLLQWNEATDRQIGRWGLTVFPRPKANWERLGKDLALMNSPDMMRKSMHTSSVFASCRMESPQSNVVSAGSH